MLHINLFFIYLYIGVVVRGANTFKMFHNFLDRVEDPQQNWFQSRDVSGAKGGKIAYSQYAKRNVVGDGDG